MSKLKDQLKSILPLLSEEANRNQDEEVRARLYLLKAIVGSQKDVKKACEARGISTDFFYEWGARLLKSKRLSALKSRSRKPKFSPKRTKKQTEKRIRRLREAEPSYGPERISFYMLKLFSIVCAPSTVYNVLGRLGLIARETRRRLSKKHLKRYTRPMPGWLQMDIKYVPYWIKGKKYYEFNAVDHHSSWRLIRAYRDKSYESLVEFLSELEKQCPFHIFQIQTDNGVEFTDKYRVNTDGKPTGWHPLDMWCAKQGIEHKLIPIGVKELNGKVENTHGFDDREFYSRYLFSSFESLELNMRGWNQRWNGGRPTRKLSWLTPDDVVALAQVRMLAILMLYRERYLPLVKLNEAVGAYVSAKAPPRARKIKLRKKVSLVSRYLQWMEWDEKKSLKSVIAVPAMSQIFPMACNIAKMVCY